MEENKNDNLQINFVCIVYLNSKYIYIYTVPCIAFISYKRKVRMYSLKTKYMKTLNFGDFFFLHYIHLMELIMAFYSGLRSIVYFNAFNEV